MVRSRRLRLLPVLALLGATRSAQAQPQADAVIAQSLFEQGRTLLSAGQVTEACVKFAESHRLDPGGGTLLNLALCHEREGRIATADAEFEAALGQAIRDNRKDREEIARARHTALTQRLPKIIITTRGLTPNLEVVIDGHTIPSSAWGAPFSVDPGERVVVARAPGRKSASTRVALAEGTTRRVTIPILEIGPHAEVPSPKASTHSPSTDPRATWPVVSVRTEDRNVMLQEQRKEAAVVIYGIGGSIIGDDGVRWFDVCSAPCDRKLDPSYVYRIGGSSVTPSPPFTITTSGEKLELDVKAGSSTGMAAGVAMTTFGLLGLIAGTTLSVLGLALSEDSADARSRNADLKGGGVLTLGTSGLLLAGGLLSCSRRRPTSSAAIASGLDGVARTCWKSKPSGVAERAETARSPSRFPRGSCKQQER